MIDKLLGVGIWVKFAFFAVLLASTAATTFHYTSVHYEVEAEALRGEVKARDEALATASASIAQLVKAIEDQNKSFDAISRARLSEQAAATAKVAVLEKTGRLLYTEIALLKSKVVRPPVDLSKMDPIEIMAEIGECRRAVEMNNVAQTGVLL